METVDNSKATEGSGSGNTEPSSAFPPDASFPALTRFPGIRTMMRRIPKLNRLLQIGLGVMIAVVVWGYLYHWERSVPVTTLAKLAGNASFDGDIGWFKGTIYNGSNWKIQQLVVRIRIVNKNGSFQWDRRFRDDVEIVPLTSKNISIQTGQAHDYEHFEWSIVEAQGHW